MTGLVRPRVHPPSITLQHASSHSRRNHFPLPSWSLGTRRRCGFCSAIRLALSILIFTCSVVAQSAASVHATRRGHVPAIEARPADVDSLDGIVKAYYETGSGPAGQPRQWARDRTLFIPGIRLVILADDAGGKRVLRQFTHEEYVDFVERNWGNRSFYEREVHRITYRYGDWAHIISTSEARAGPDGPVTGHGIDTLELFWDGKRWWIVNATIVVERPNAPVPKQFLP